MDDKSLSTSADFEFLKSWMLSESGQHMDQSLPIEWKYNPLLERQLPHIFKNDIFLLDNKESMEALVVEYRKRNRLN